MHLLTNAEAVTSGVASLILFSTTLCAGYALAANGNAGHDAAPTAVVAVPVTAESIATADCESRIARLHDRLMVTAAQESLWHEVASIMRINDRAVDALATARHEGAAKRTAVEDLRSYGEITAAHAVGIRAFAPAFAALYESMTETQKQNADAVFRRDERLPEPKAT